MLDAFAAVTKALLYVGIFSAAGTALASASLYGATRTASYAPQVMRKGAWLTGVAALVGAAILFFQLGGNLDEATLSAVFMSSKGASLCLQLTGALLLLAASDDDLPERGLKLSEAALLLISLGISGHAAAAGLLQGLLVILHVAAAAWWAGALLLLRDACGRGSILDLAQLVQRFSSWALRIVATLVVAGIVLLLALIDLDEQPLLTPYLKILVAKVVLVAGALSLAAYNKFRLTPRLRAGQMSAGVTLRNTIGAELLLILLVLAVTAVLTTYTAPR